MSDTVLAIKEKLNIADVLRSYITLIPAGKNLKANCPFHHEKSPSFMVSTEKQLWHCFGCGEGGDMFKFVMRFENIEFFEALKFLAEKAGVEMKMQGGIASEAYKNIYEINRIAKDFFCSNLYGNLSAHQAEAAKYLKERGLKSETIKEFEIGLASISNDALLRHLVLQKKSLADIEKAGLVFKSERGTYWDRFRGRIMFPLYNSFGKIIGFTGRVLPSQITSTGMDAAKYVNSPETPIFNKSKLLYGFHASKNYIRDFKTVIVVEGQMDFLMMWQDGIKNVIASSGTALTSEHLSVLRRLADNLILSFDSDAAGVAAAERSIDLASAIDFNVKMLTIKGDFKDPADVVLASPGTMAKFIADASPAMEYYFNRYINNRADIIERKKNIRVILGKIKQIASPVEREHFINELSNRTGVGATALIEEMQNIKIITELKLEIFKPLEASQVIAQEKLTRRDLISERVIKIILSNIALKKEVDKFQNALSNSYQILYKNLVGADFVNVPSELQSLADSLVFKASFANDYAGADIALEIRNLLKELQSSYLRERLEDARAIIAASERMGDEDAMSKALKEFDSITKELHNGT